MKVYSVMVEKNVDEELDTYILGDAAFTNEAECWKMMLDDAQSMKNDWNKSDDHFDLEVFAACRGCSVISHDHPDYINYNIVEMDVK